MRTIFFFFFLAVVSAQCLIPSNDTVYSIASEYELGSRYELSGAPGYLELAVFTNSANQRWTFTLICSMCTNSAYYYIDVVSQSLTCCIDSSQTSLCGSKSGSSSQMWLVTAQSGTGIHFPNLITISQPTNNNTWLGYNGNANYVLGLFNASSNQTLFSFQLSPE
jgi:hypothetical protein